MTRALRDSRGWGTKGPAARRDLIELIYLARRAYHKSVIREKIRMRGRLFHFIHIYIHALHSGFHLICEGFILGTLFPRILSPSHTHTHIKSWVNIYKIEIYIIPFSSSLVTSANYFHRHDIDVP